MAHEVYRRLIASGERVAHYQVPYPKTFLALIDDPAIAETDHSMPAGQRRLDVDLDGMDVDLARRYSQAMIFEFHNSEDTQPILRIDPTKPLLEYVVGTIRPGSDQFHEIGIWHNVDRLGDARGST